MTREEFEKLVSEGLDLIPEEFLAKLDNVAIVVEDEPTEYQRQKAGLSIHHTLYGLYEGVPQTRRGVFYGNVLPDKITIFKNAIESHFKTEEAIRNKVKETVWHEIAHHFGMSEGEIRQAEARKKN